MTLTDEQLAEIRGRWEDMETIRMDARDMAGQSQEECHRRMMAWNKISHEAKWTDIGTLLGEVERLQKIEIRFDALNEELSKLPVRASR